MLRTLPRVVMLASVAVVTGFAVAGTQQENQSDSAPRRLSAPMQTFMDAKLTATQSVLSGLLTRDFDRIRKAAESLRDMALTAPPEEAGGEFDKEVYEHFRTEFTRLSGQLVTMAERRNFEGAAWVHQSLTSTCISCHDYVRDKASPADVQSAALGTSK